MSVVGAFQDLKNHNCIRSINTGKDNGESIFSIVFTSVY